MLRRVTAFRTCVAALLVLGAVSLGACTSPPPALTKAELDAAKLPKKHPEVEKVAEDGCRSCHKEQPPIKQP